MPLVGGFGWLGSTMISTNESTVYGWIWTNESVPLCHQVYLEMEQGQAGLLNSTDVSHHLSYRDEKSDSIEDIIVCRDGNVKQISATSVLGLIQDIQSLH